MKGKLNIYRDNFLEKEELDRLMSFIGDNPALFLFVSNAQSFGIVQQGASLSTDPAFKVEVGTNSNTIKIITDSYALDKNGNLIYQRAFDNLSIPTDSLWYWVKLAHRWDNYEVGYVDIAVDGTLSGVNTVFTEVLRGSSSGFPVKIKFFTQDNDGLLTPATNSGIYEVVSVAGDNTAVLAGSFTAESNLRYVVLGAFSIKTSVGAITSTGIYSYDSCDIEFILEEDTDVPPVTGFVEDEEFYIARISCDGATVTVEDKRSDYYFRLNFGDIIVSNKANINASNLTAPDITAWLTALSVYTQAQIDSVLGAFLTKAQNLNDVANKTTARSNLGVYGTAYVDGVIGDQQYANNNIITDSESITASLDKLDQAVVLKTKVINIGDWNMDVNQVAIVVLGIDFKKVRSVSIIIRNDDDTLYSDFLSVQNGSHLSVPLIQLGVVGSDVITLQHNTGGFYDGVDYNATSYNRGWITIRYIA